MRKSTWPEWLYPIINKSIGRIDWTERIYSIFKRCIRRMDWPQRIHPTMKKAKLQVIYSQNRLTKSLHSGRRIFRVNLFILEKVYSVNLIQSKSIRFEERNLSNYEEVRIERQFKLWDDESEFIHLDEVNLLIGSLLRVRFMRSVSWPEWISSFLKKYLQSREVYLQNRQRIIQLWGMSIMRRSTHSESLQLSLFSEQTDQSDYILSSKVPLTFCLLGNNCCISVIACLRTIPSAFITRRVQLRGRSNYSRLTRVISRL